MELNTLGAVLAVFGLLLSAFGSALLAYDIFRSPVYWFQEESNRLQLESINRLHESVINDLYSLPTPPYSEEEKNKLIKEQIEKYQVCITEEEKSREQKNLQQRFYSQKLALKGFLLVVLGSVLQAVAVVLSQLK